MSTLDIEKLYRTYYMQVYAYAMTVVKDSNVAEEVTQQTFVTALSADYKRLAASGCDCPSKQLGNSSHFAYDGGAVQGSV